MRKCTDLEVGEVVPLLEDSVTKWNQFDLSLRFRRGTLLLLLSHAATAARFTPRVLRERRQKTV